MPELVACPQCGRKLKVPDTLLGKRVKCPGCQTAFTAAASKPAAAENKAPAPTGRKPYDEDDDGPQRYEVTVEEKPEEEDDDGPPKRGLIEEHLRKQLQDERSKRGKRPFTDNWKKARIGLRILSLAVFILAANFIVMTAGKGIIHFATKPDDLKEHPTERDIATHKAQVKFAEEDRKEKERYLTSAVAIVYLVHHLVALIGIGFCLLSPDKNYLRVYAAAALLLGVIAMGLEIGCGVAPLQYLISQAVDAQGNIPPPHPVLKIFTDLTGYLRCFAFLFFIRVVAVTTKADDLRREVLLLMIAMAIVTLFWLVMAILTAVKLPADFGTGVGCIVMQGSIIGVLGMGSLGLMLAAMVWFTMTLYSTSVAITDWIRER